MPLDNPATRQPWFSVEAIVSLHRDTTDAWHQNQTRLYLDGVLPLVCEQHRFNYLLWHEEDIARSPTASDGKIASVKRAIDAYNQKRNDAIEKIDNAIADHLLARQVIAPADAPLNSETPGSIIDRLSILTLRRYHLDEQSTREDLDAKLESSINEKKRIAQSQHEDLVVCLQQLWEDLIQTRKRHKTYRQLKMYNDPQLNPYLYGQGRSEQS